MKAPYIQFIIPVSCELGIWSQIFHRSPFASPTVTFTSSGILQIEVKVEIEDRSLANFYTFKLYLRQLNSTSYMMVVFFAIDPVEL